MRGDLIGSRDFLITSADWRCQAYHFGRPQRVCGKRTTCDAYSAAIGVVELR